MGSGRGGVGVNDIRIVLADDEKLLRTALATLLEIEGGIQTLIHI